MLHKWFKVSDNLMYMLVGQHTRIFTKSDISLEISITCANSEINWTLLPRVILGK